MPGKRAANDFAIAGGTAEFAEQLPVGQLYFPSWERYETAMRGIFEREYYTNHGPLLEQLEERLQLYFGVKHVICVTNATVGLTMVAKALVPTGKVVVPAFTFPGSAQSISWAGLEPAFCDVDAATHHATAETIEPAMQDDVRAILAVNLWGGACDVRALEAYASQKGMYLFFDSAHALGSSIDGTRMGGFGSAEVFSFHATKVLNATEGGCICTNDDDLAAILRNMRCGYGMGRIVEVPVTTNGRMSEAQAAIALLSLDDLEEHIQRNVHLARIYSEEVQGISGFHIVVPSGVDLSNYQYLVCEVDEEQFGLPRDALLQLLKAENVNARRYFYPGVHRCVPYVTQLPQYVTVLPNTDRLCSSLIQLPIGALVSDESAHRIGRLIGDAARCSAALRDRIGM
ncbi:MAG: aminotransferase class I/II-fold pyridoxal phosphate-dependent enzyme [Vulcanimicrobiaceae bacterium]